MTRSACGGWKDAKECVLNPNFMRQRCPKSCGSCKGSDTRVRLPFRRMWRLAVQRCCSCGSGAIRRQTEPCLRLILAPEHVRASAGKGQDTGVRHPGQLQGVFRVLPGSGEPASGGQLVPL